VFLNLEHQLLKQIKAYDFQTKEFFLAVSGGMDSIVLLHLFLSLRKILPVSAKVMHVHHGGSENNEQLAFRNQALSFVKSTCAQADIEFISNENWPEVMLKSEEQFRDLRYDFFSKYLLSERQVLVLAHHHEDLLETRLLRLIRGTSLLGLCAMKELEGQVYRPLLSHSKDELKKYAEAKKIQWKDDPSNDSEDPFRNWLRHNWLPQLEAFQGGAKKSLSGSLQKLVDEGAMLHEDLKLSDYSTENQLNISRFLTLNSSRRLTILARFLRQHKLYKYNQNHLRELDKRISDFKSNCEFSLLKNNWILDGEFLILKN
jgi:tRNA(Ile)-lysidine synthase